MRFCDIIQLLYYEFESCDILCKVFNEFLGEMNGIVVVVEDGFLDSYHQVEYERAENQEYAFKEPEEYIPEILIFQKHLLLKPKYIFNDSISFIHIVAHLHSLKEEVTN